MIERTTNGAWTITGDNALEVAKAINQYIEDKAQANNVRVVHMRYDYNTQEKKEK